MKRSTLILIISLIVVWIIFPPQITEAVNMSNADYILRMANLNMAAGNVSNSSYKLGYTAGETAPGLYSLNGVNYKVRAGFQYVRTTIPFSFSISSIFVDFGTVTPGEPITRTNNLTVSNGSAHGYSVVAFEKQPLRVYATGADIPDTTCDAGNCTESTAAAWSNPLTYGFGYRCDNLSGTDCVTDFSDSSFYKQFANQEASETPQAVMSGANVGKNKRAEITYKVNISASQPAGDYQTIINYIATPTF